MTQKPWESDEIVKPQQSAPWSEDKIVSKKASPYTGTQDFVVRGMSLGASDYVGGAAEYVADKLTGGDETYNDALKKHRGEIEAYRDQNPVRAYGGEIFGGLVSPLLNRFPTKGVPAPAAPEAGSTLARYGRYAGKGAIQGAAVGAGNAQGDDGGLPSMGDLAQSTAIGAAGGAALGAAVPAIAEGAASAIGKVANAVKAPPPGMTQEEIRQASKAAYKTAEDAGVIVKPEEFQKFVQDLPGKLEGFRARVAPKAASVLDEFAADAAAGKPVTLDNLEELRQLAIGASKTMDRNEVRLISAIKDHLDDFIDDLQPSQLMAGDAKSAGEALKEARSLWRTNAKLRNINDIIEIGEGLNDGNWVKNQFRAIIRKPRVFNGYSAEEQEIIKDIARTGSLEKLAKIIPWRGLQMSSTYINPLMQEGKLAQLQRTVAAGGKSSLGAIYGMTPQQIGQRTSRLPLVPVMSPFMTGGSNQ